MEAIDLKDTQYSWLGSIPEEWKKVSLKYLFYIQKGRKPSIEYEEYQDGLLPYLSMDVLRGKNDFPVYTSPLEDKTLVLASEEDILILWDGSKAGEFVPGTKGALSSTMARMSLINQAVDQTFLMYYLKNSESYIQNNTIGMGIPHVDGDVLRNLPIFLPSLPEQKQIARFIDHQTGLIDAVIAKKETLIKKLKEQRQATINEAVTKGLNPNTPLKDSGIPWLGEIPEHWEVVKLKRMAKIKNGKDQKEVLIDEGGYPVLGTGGEFGRASKFLYDKPSVLLGRKGTIDKPQFIEEPFWTVDTLFYTEVFQNTNPRFLFYSSTIIPFNSLQESSAVPSMTQEKLHNVYLCRPPKPEQDEIVEQLEGRLDVLKEIIQKIETQIDKLREYRQSLISEAVTGKIDVREWKPKNN